MITVNLRKLARGWQGQTYHRDVRGCQCKKLTRTRSELPFTTHLKSGEGSIGGEEYSFCNISHLSIYKKLVLHYDCINMNIVG